MRSDVDRTVNIKLRNKPNGSIIYLEELIDVSSTYKNYSILFQAPNNDNDVRLTLLMGSDSNNIYFDSVSFTEYCSSPNIADLHCDEFIFLKDHSLVSTTYHSSERLQSDGAVVPNNSTSFKAEDEIFLMPNFCVPLNADFDAVIEDCN